jgi:hypothetical protein
MRHAPPPHCSCLALSLSLSDTADRHVSATSQEILSATNRRREEAWRSLATMSQRSGLRGRKPNGTNRGSSRGNQSGRWVGGWEGGWVGGWVGGQWAVLTRAGRGGNGARGDDEPAHWFKARQRLRSQGGHRLPKIAGHAQCQSGNAMVDCSTPLPAIHTSPHTPDLHYLYCHHTSCAHISARERERERAHLKSSVKLAPARQRT